MSPRTVENLTAALDDAAARGDVKKARRIASAYWRPILTHTRRMLMSAADSRGTAILYRLAGDIDTAIAWEQLSDSYLRNALSALIDEEVTR